jgi:sporulation protein YlmC with PRC-barrel domain
MHDLSHNKNHKLEVHSLRNKEVIEDSGKGAGEIKEIKLRE